MKKKVIAKYDVIAEKKQPEEVTALELLQSGKLNKCAVIQVMRKVDLKKVGIVAGGAAVVMSAVSLTGKYSFYKGIVSSELKRQLAPMNKKLDELKAQNEALKKELDEIKAQNEE